MSLLAVRGYRASNCRRNICYNPKIINYKNVLFKDDNSLNTHKDNLYYGDHKMIASKRHKYDTETSYRGNSLIPYEEALKIAKRLDDGESAKNIAA